MKTKTVGVSPDISIRIEIDSTIVADLIVKVSSSGYYQRYSLSKYITGTHTTKTVRIINGTNQVIVWGCMLDP